MKILGIDFETTGLEKTDRVTEIGAVLWDWEERKPLQLMSELVYSIEHPKLTDEIVKLTGITHEMLDEYAKDPRYSFLLLSDMVSSADYLMAHNAPFDKEFYDREYDLLGLLPPERKWLCSRKDVDYPEAFSQKLKYLAAEHGVINPFSHRAVFDVLTMFQVVQNYDLEQIIKWADTPDVMIRAQVTFAEKDKAKQRGYHWNPEQKIWFKTIKEFRVTQEAEQARKAGFEIRRLQ